MEIKIQKKDLMKGLAWTQSVVERKSTMPILANCLLSAKNKVLTISATDLEIGVVVDIPCETPGEGSVTANARALFDIVKELSDDKIHITVLPNNWLQIQSGKSQFKIVGLAATEFPSLPSGDSSDTVTMPIESFREMIAKTSYAMSTDETRYTLNGVFLDLVKDPADKDALRLRMVATDGHRLSYADRPVQGKWKLDKGVIVPRKGILEWKKLLEGEGGEFSAAFDPKHVTIRRDNVTLVIRLIDGQFPPYNQVIPKEHKWTIAVDRQSLMQALRRCQLVTTEKSRGVQFRLSPGHMDISAQNPDVGEAHEELKVNYRGETFDLGFNARYFLDLLAVIEDEQAVLELKGEMGPCTVRSEFDRAFLAVIMPMRL